MTVKQFASKGGKARNKLPNIFEIRSAAAVKRGETMRQPGYKRPGKRSPRIYEAWRKAIETGNVEILYPE